MAKYTNWNRDEHLLALRLYMRTTFGRLHSRNPEIIELAKKIGRTPGAVAMKASNFASLDPNLKRKGLKNAGPAAEAIWNEFASNSARLAAEAEEAAERIDIARPDQEVLLRIPTGATERESLVTVRRVQTFFRSAVMTSYDGTCALSGIAEPGLLVASHIIPWSVSIEHRADPRNGLCLNALFDRAFDRGLMTFDADHRVVLSKRLREDVRAARMPCSILDAEGEQLRLPERLPPLAECMAYHRERVFAG